MTATERSDNSHSTWTLPKVATNGVHASDQPKGSTDTSTTDT